MCVSDYGYVCMFVFIYTHSRLCDYGGDYGEAYVYMQLHALANAHSQILGYFYVYVLASTC